MNDPVRRSRPLWVALGACACYLLASQLGVILRGGNPFTDVRTLYWLDQLSYLAIVANVQTGELAPVEPFTLTGVSHYPMGYYTLVGLVARLFGIPATTSWNMVGLTVQLLAVAAISLATARFSRRWWLGFLAPLPFVVGTYAFALNGLWYSPMQFHALLWGPFGALFPKNAESSGLALAAILLVACVWAWLSSGRTAVRGAVVVLCAGGVGLLASFQTYSFLTASYFAAFLTAAVAIVGARHRRWWLPATALLLLVVIVAGPSLSRSLGQLPTLAFGLLPTLPGLGLAIRQTRGLVAGAGLAACAGAAHQVLFTVDGLLSRDPFLLYRVASNHSLGVADPVTLVSSLAIGVPLLAAARVALLRRRPDIAALSLASVVCWGYLALNDAWGANAEPYRFWINGALLAAVVALVSWSLLVAADPAGSVPSPVSARAAGSQRRWLAVSLVSVLVSLPDVVLFTADPEAQATWNPATSRDAAITRLAKRVTADGEGLILTDRCIDPRTTKAMSGVAIVYYNDGLAWPERKPAIDVLLTSARPTGIVTAGELRAADVRWVLTDSHCGFRVGPASGQLRQVASEPYVLTPADVVDAAHPDLAGSQPLPGDVMLWQVTD